jgi:uncharacterized membrane protein (DUF2068 family)
MNMNDYRRSAGITALSILFAFGAFMTGIMVIVQFFSNSAADQTSHAQQGFGPASQWSLWLMAVACLACIAAAYGLWRLMRWGLWTAIVILGANLVGDAISIFSSLDWRTLIQVPIIGLMIWYLLRQRPLFEASVAQSAIPVHTE